MMPSPFPGMDPYLEYPGFWSDFHDSFVVYWRDALNDVLPESYEARVNERTRLVDLSEGSDVSPKPDVVVHHSGDEGPARPASSGVATIEPVTLPLRWLDEERETYVEIRHRPERTVVAALELLSPSNKTGGDRLLYLQKRNAMLHQDVHLIELDLLRGGQRIPLDGVLPRGDYFYFLSRSDRSLNCQVFAWSVRDALPVVPVPLRAPDSDLMLDLSTVFATAFNRGRYGRSLHYDAIPPGPWPVGDRDWIMERARQAAQ